MQAAATAMTGGGLEEVLSSAWRGALEGLIVGLLCGVVAMAMTLLSPTLGAALLNEAGFSAMVAAWAIPVFLSSAAAGTYHAKQAGANWGKALLEGETIGVMAVGGMVLFAGMMRLGGAALARVRLWWNARAGSGNAVPRIATIAKPVDGGNVEGPSGGHPVYGDLDELGRPTGVRATITEDMIGTGTPASPSIRPPGFQGSHAGQARGHLLGAQLGGSGTDPRNLVTMQQTPANSPVMRGFENLVRVAVEGGQVVDLTVTPIYSGSGLIPRGITMMAQGSGGFHIAVTILNPPGFP